MTPMTPVSQTHVFELRTLPAGSVVYMNGLPVQLPAPTDAMTTAENWKLIDTVPNPKQMD